MLEGLKRLFTRGGASSNGDWDGVQPWAAAKQYDFRGVQSEGFVVDGRVGATPWRLEWGPSQRAYIAGHELRIRSELGLGSDLHALVMNRTLQEQMEAAVFNQYVEGVQTRIDNQTPPEMRWLVMFPKLSSTEMGDLRERYVALASKKGWMLRWLQGSLALALASHRVSAAVPLVLMIGRGRLMLRTEMPDADVNDIERWLRLFETAVREAQRAAIEGGEAVNPSAEPAPRAELPDD
jgi:hypothetical protein